MKNVIMVQDMQICLKENNKKKITVTLSVLTILFAMIATVITDVVFPVSAALFATVLLLEKGKKKYLSLSLGAVILVLNLVSVFVIKSFMLTGLEIIFFGIIIAFCFSKNISKADTAFMACAVVVVFTVLTVYSIAVSYTGGYTFDSVKTFYSELYGSLKVELQKSLSELSSTLPQGAGEAAISLEQFFALLDSMLPMLISFVFIFAFAVTGFTLKIFSFIILRISDDKNQVFGWRFKMGSLFAYFYLVLYFLQLFTANSVSLYTVCVLNLLNIFCVIFAYVGFNFIFTMFSVKHSPVFTFILLIVGLLMFSTILIDILAIVGAFVTITGNKAISKK